MRRYFPALAVAVGFCLLLWSQLNSASSVNSSISGRFEASQITTRSIGVGPDDRDPAPGSAGIAVDVEAERQARGAYVIAEVETDMQIDETYEARLIVSRSNAQALLFSRQTQEPTVISEDVRLTHEASASLTSAKFDIHRTSPDWQAITASTPSVWTWTVKPKYPGRATLTFHLHHRVEMNGRVLEPPVRHFPKEVDIRVGFWRGLLSWLESAGGGISTLIAALAGVTVIATFWIKYKPRTPEAREPNTGVSDLPKADPTPSKRRRKPKAKPEEP